MRSFKPRGQDPIFKRPKTNSKNFLKHIKSLESLQLPSIYSKSLKMKTIEVSLQSSNDIRREMSKVVTFAKQKPTSLQGQIYSMLPEQVKGVMNTSQAHRQSIALVNKIFNSCDIILKEKDILLTEGKKSQAKYMLINNGIYKPKSVCCQQTVVFKCIDKIGIEEQRKMIKKVHLICLECGKIILRFIEKEGGGQNKADKKRKLLDFALHIASGRYKSHKLEQDPINNSLIHIKSRVSNHMNRGLQSLG